MPPCNCGGKRAGIKYQVTYPDKTTEKVATVGEAQSKVRTKGGTFKAVAA